MSKTKFKKGIGYVPDWYVSYPSLLINKHLYKGIPSGSIIQVQGDGEGSFKSTTSLQIGAEVQKLGYDIAYIDAENAVFNDENERGTQTNAWFESMGLNLEQMYIVECAPMEQLWQDARELIEDYNVKYVIFDSIHAMQPSKIHEQDAGESIIGLHAKIHGTELVKISRLLRKHHAILCGINHKKDVITNRGSMGKKAIGGKGWGFYTQLIVVNKRTNSKSKLEGQDMIPLDVYLEKNKFGESFKSVSTEVMQGKGFVPEMELAMLAKNNDIIYKKGSWWKVKKTDDTIGQNELDLMSWVSEHEQELKDKLL